MHEPLSCSELARLSERIVQLLGLSFPLARHRDLERGLREAAAMLRYSDPNGFARALLSIDPDRRVLDVLAGCLTVGETYFYREPRSMRALERALLPRLIEAKRRTDRRLRFWSAGCCTGEEPYTLAALLRNALSDPEAWSLSIQGTDINPGFLERARNGYYRSWSFRAAPELFRQRFFEPELNGLWRIRPEILEMVRFSQLNLVVDAYPSLLNQTADMDLILCRNVLMYFDPETRQRVFERLADCLRPGGFLLVGAGEAGHVEPGTRLRLEQIEGTSCFRRATAGENEELVTTRPTVWALDERFPRLPELPDPPLFPWSSNDSSNEYVVDPQPEEKALSQTGESLMPMAPEPVPPGPDEPAEHPVERSAAEIQAGIDELRACLDRRRVDRALDVIAGLPEPPVEATLRLASLLADVGRLGEAETWCRISLERNVLETKAYQLLASILQEEGELTGARRALEQWLFLEPQSAVAHYQLGLHWLRGGDIARARRSLSQARTLAASMDPEQEIPQADGLRAGRLEEVVASKLSRM